MRRAVALGTTAAGGLAAAVCTSRLLERQRRSLDGFDMPDIATAVGSLQSCGVGVVDGLVGSDLVRRIESTEVVRSAPTALSRPSRSRPRARAPATAEWRVSASGRFHRRSELFNGSDLEVFDRLEERLSPLVSAFFDGDVSDVYCSELQVMTAVPGSATQAWHADNCAQGLTIIVPLIDFSAGNGATQLLVGSHTNDWPLIARQGARVVTAHAGAVVAFDSRTCAPRTAAARTHTRTGSHRSPTPRTRPPRYHRGLGNEGKGGRPALIVCYDRKGTPPPGYGTMGSLGNAYLGTILNVLSAGWLTCTSR